MINIKKILFNTFWLNIFQVTLILFPLIIYPYLFRTLGVYYFGYISFVNAYFLYANKFIDYSFFTYAVKDIAVKEDTEEKIFFTVHILRLMIWLLSVVILGVIYITLLFEKIDITIFLYSSGSLLGYTFLPYWFLRARQVMKLITIFNFIMKLVLLIIIFIFIKKPQDYILYFKIDFLVSFSFGLISLFYVIRKFRLKFIYINFKSIYDYFKKGWLLFAGEILALLYSSSNIFILGLLAGNSLAGYYSISEKVVFSLKGFLSVFVYGAFPEISNSALISKTDTKTFIKKALIGMGAIGLTLTILFIIFADKIIFILTGGINIYSVLTIQFLSPVIFIFSLSAILLNLYLLSYGRYDIWFKNILMTFIFTIIFFVTAIFISDNYLYIVIYTTLFSEIFILILGYFNIKKANLGNVEM